MEARNELMHGSRHKGKKMLCMAAGAQTLIDHKFSNELESITSKEFWSLGLVVLSGITAQYMATFILGARLLSAGWKVRLLKYAILGTVFHAGMEASNSVLFDTEPFFDARHGITRNAFSFVVDSAETAAMFAFIGLAVTRTIGALPPKLGIGAQTSLLGRLAETPVMQRLLRRPVDPKAILPMKNVLIGNSAVFAAEAGTFTVWPFLAEPPAAGLKSIYDWNPKEFKQKIHELANIDPLELLWNSVKMLAGLKGMHIVANPFQARARVRISEAREKKLGKLFERVEELRNTLEEIEITSDNALEIISYVRSKAQELLRSLERLEIALTKVGVKAENLKSEQNGIRAYLDLLIPFERETIRDMRLFGRNNRYGIRVSYNGVSTYNAPDALPLIRELRRHPRIQNLEIEEETGVITFDYTPPTTQSELRIRLDPVIVPKTTTEKPDRLPFLARFRKLAREM